MADAGAPPAPEQNGEAEEPKPMIHPSRLAALGLAPPAAPTPPPVVAPSFSGSNAPIQADEERRSKARSRSRSRDRKRRRSKSRSRSRDRKERRDKDRDRDDKDRRERRRSRSRSRDRDRRRRSRSRDRDRGDRRKTGARRVPSRYWDVAAPGYEGVSPMQFKIMLAAGQVPASAMVSMIPGYGPQLPAPGEAPVVPPINPMIGMGMPGGASLPIQPQAMVNNQLTRQARRLYIGSIPLGATDPDMLNFFNETMVAAGLNTQPGNPILTCQVNLEKNFAFLEVRSIDETTNALALDGIMYRGTVLKIRRPKDYVPLPGQNPEPPSNVYIPGVISTTVPDNEHKMFIGGLPPYFNDDQVKELLQAFGMLRAFNLVKDTATGVPKGFAFFQYVDPVNNDKAIAGLHGMQVGEKQLVVQRSSLDGAGRRQELFAGGILPVGMNLEQESQPTTVLVLLNMVQLEELADDEEYGEILEDIQDECSKFGTVASVRIPRPGDPGDSVPGLGKVFVEYATIAEAKNGQEHLAGRKFGGQTVLTSFLPPEKYHEGLLDG